MNCQFSVNQKTRKQIYNGRWSQSKTAKVAIILSIVLVVAAAIFSVVFLQQPVFKGSNSGLNLIIVVVVDVIAALTVFFLIVISRIQMGKGLNTYDEELEISDNFLYYFYKTCSTDIPDVNGTLSFKYVHNNSFKINLDETKVIYYKNQSSLAFFGGISYKGSTAKESPDNDGYYSESDAYPRVDIPCFYEPSLPDAVASMMEPSRFEAREEFTQEEKKANSKQGLVTALTIVGTIVGIVLIAVILTWLKIV